MENLNNGASVADTHLQLSAPVLWLASPDETDVLRYIASNYDAATLVIPALDAGAFPNDTARELFIAARAVWRTGEPVTAESIAVWCDDQADQCQRAADQSERGFASVPLYDAAALWRERAAIARADLATAPTGAKDGAKEAENIARRLAKVPRFEFATLGEVFSRPDPAFLIDQLLTVGGTSLLTAKHASFKSFFALDMGLCIATGRGFHGLECQRGSVIYIAAEGASGLKKRARAWLAHHGISEVPENFLVLDKPFQIADESQRAAFARATETKLPALIVLDTLARCAVGLDENNAKDMGAFADAVAALARATGAHVMTVHHNNKGGEYRGSSALPAAVDTHLTLERHKESDAVTLTSEKQKDAPEHPPLSFEKMEVLIPDTQGADHSLIFNLVETSSGSRWRLSAMEQKVLDALELIATDAGATSSQWKAAADTNGVSNGAFYMGLKRLTTPVSEHGLGLVTLVSGEHGKRGALYTPTLQNTPNEALE